MRNFEKGKAPYVEEHEDDDEEKQLSRGERVQTSLKKTCAGPLGFLHRIKARMPAFIHRPTGKRYIPVFLAGLYFLSCPNFGIEATPGYAGIQRIIPGTYLDKKRWPHTIGALLVTASLTRSTVLKKPLAMVYLISLLNRY